MLFDFIVVSVTSGTRIVGGSMSKEPNGEIKYADSIGCAVTVAKIATGEIEDQHIKKSNRRRRSLAGAYARATSLTNEQRSDIAKKETAARWKMEA